MILSRVLGQPSWRIASADLEPFATKLGGHLGRVRFDWQGHKFQPFSAALLDVSFPKQPEFNYGHVRRKAPSE
jgi:hypothetical protein